MTWPEVGFAILLFVVGLADLALVAIVGFFLILLLQFLWPWKKPRPAPVFADTSFGRFRRVPKNWVCDVPVAITALDRDDAPDPAFIARLPGLVADLPRLEALARAFDEDDFDEDFELCGLDQGRGEEDFILLFGAAWDEQGDIGTLLVAFSAGKPVSATLVH